MKTTSKFLVVMAVAMTALLVSQNVVFAAGSNEQIYYFNDHYKIKDDKGFSLDEKEKIKTKDVHYGWDLGSLYVRGYTQRTEDLDGNPVFLKNAKDRVVLGFKLEQDIDKLNGNEKLSIAQDKKGYDDYFEVPKTNFGRGVLITRYTDYQNSKGDPIIYTNYLSAEAEVNANTVIELNEEGDYEVALDYVVKNSPRKILNKNILPTESDYTIRLFKFSVRNGNSMVFPRDAKTGQELSNKAFTENGFMIDLAESHYLKVFVRRDDDSEDTRENKPAKDGSVYKKEGVYTITVEDPSTNQTTTKKIYVGTDDLYKAYVTTGLSPEEIKSKLDEGASISEDGNIILTTGEELEQGVASSDEHVTSTDNQNESTTEKHTSIPMVSIIAAAVLLILIMIVISGKKSKNKKSSAADSEGRD